MKVLICFVVLLVSVALNEAASHSRLVRSPQFSGSSASASAQSQSGGGRGGSLNGSSAKAESSSFNSGRGGSSSIASANAESASFNNRGPGAYRPTGNAGRPGRSGHGGFGPGGFGPQPYLAPGPVLFGSSAGSNAQRVG